jgi:UDP-3-O-[3-hydroxymyristoyl] glucosamine N-acyltransferase
MSHPSFFRVRTVTTGEIAALTGSSLRDSSLSGVTVSQAGPIEAAGSGSLSFVDNPRYLKHVPESAAAAIFVAPKFADRVPPHICALLHEQPYRAYARALAMIYETAARPEPVTGETGVSTAAHIAANVLIEEDVIVEPGVVIGEGAAIGRGSRVLANAVIGRNVQIGRNTTIGIGASVTHAFVGDNVIIHPGVRIGQDGFGFAMGAGGHLKVPQIGRVIIQDYVEIGANTTIDRGSNRDTVIGEGTKIDNLVQIGHNVTIGRHCVIVGLAGIAGSASLGDYVVIAGQAGIVGHIHVGSGAQVGGGSGVNFDVKPGEKIIGYPAQDIRSWTKMNMILKSLVAKSRAKGGAQEQGE